ncbi:hypothetical protein R3P38DRAFT_2936835 [Favolaschia claudopus]|uniref:Novel STAND NTPase 1 domain-containing protein n=1 Tax=Favolaschia claudopus TaxID=2862362 RepID=A0AAW0BPA2_9AGAR
MPRHPKPTDRVEIIVAGLAPLIPLLKEVTDAFDTPFLPAISVTISSLLAGVLTAKKNKEECAALLEDINVVLLAIVELHINSETPGSLAPAMLHQLGRFTETLHKVHTFVDAQQEARNVKSFFRHAEMNTLLKECRKGLQDAFDVFKIEVGAALSTNIDDLQQKTENTHQKLLELISSFSEETLSERMSSGFYRNLSDSQLSSRSFSMLPSEPKIFHGRDTELKQIVEIFQQDSPRVSILGPGGIGKTSLARIALHHPEIASKFEHRFFVSCEAAFTSIDIAASIAAYLDIKPGPDLMQPVITSLTAKPSSLLILDNLEYAWEPAETRTSVEEFLSLLTDIPHLALIVTLRGAENPAKVRWTRPFLPPLMPLSDDAAQQMFMDIADEDLEEMDKLLGFTDNLPLAVELLAHLVIYDGAPSVLARWEIEKTSLLSEGYDRRSSLDASIAMSLSSPRLGSVPGAMPLLQLLSILPDGLSDVELLQSNLPIADILRCKTVLLSTSLAYMDDKRRIKSLVPIREYMQHIHPAPLSLVQALQNYFDTLLDLNQRYFGTIQTAASVEQITLNLGNLHQILLQGLNPQNPYLEATVTCLLSLNIFGRKKGRGWHPLMNSVTPLLHLCQPRLEVLFITEVFRSQLQWTIGDPDSSISRAQSQMDKANDPILESQFYSMLAFHYANMNNPEARAMMARAVELVNTTEHVEAHAEIFTDVANFYWRFGEYQTGRGFAQKAAKLAQSKANLYEEARAMRVEAGCNIFLGEFKSTVFILRRARELAGLCGLSEGVVYYRTLDLEADIHLRKSEYKEANKIYTLIAQKRTAAENPLDHAYALLGVGETNTAMGYDGSQTLEEARNLFANIGLPSGKFICETIIAEHLLKKGNAVTRDLKASLEKGLQWSWTDDPQTTFYALQRMGNVSAWPKSDFKWAATNATTYLVFGAVKKENLALHKALCCLGDVFLANGDTMTAQNLFIVSLDGFTKMDVHRGRAECLIRLGDLANSEGNSARAKEHWEKAAPLFVCSSQMDGVAAISKRLAST